MKLKELFKNDRVVGIVGNTGTAKSSLALTELLDIKSKVDIDIYVLGVEPCLHEHLEKKGIKVLKSKDDILDMKITNSVIYIDEFGDLFSTSTQDKQLIRLSRFFNRIEHLNNFVLISSAHENFWNKFMCGLVRSYLVKKIEYDSLVNGTTLKRKVLGIVENSSDYRLDVPNDVYYAVTNDDVVERCTFKYDKDLDSKKEKVNPFSDGKAERKNETKGEKK